jgi:hypothetical protein
LKKKIKLLILSAILSGCTTVEFSKTGKYQAGSLDENCDFTVYTTRPDENFKEVGVVDLIGGAASLPRTVRETKNLVSESVCTNGGNGLLLWEANGYGGYTKGTVIFIN